MKLGIVTHSVMKGEGQGRVNYEVAREAIRRGHHLALLASRIAPELQQSDQVDWIYVPVKGWPTAFLRNLVFSWRSANWLRKHRCELDLVKVNGAITKAPGDINAVHFVHSSWLRSPAHISRVRRDWYGAYQWLFTALNARWEKQAFRQAKCLVAVSDKVKEELTDIGVPKESIRVITNGVDLQEFSPGIADRKKLNLPEGVPIALFAGDIRTPRKNLDTVLNALVQVPELHLAIVGTTEGSPYLQLAERLGLSERVHFLGYRRDVSKLMRAVNLFVFPSRYEACTLALLEAMASGLPVISATSTGGAELVTSDCGIVLSDSEDISALVQALSILKSNPEQRARMGKASRVTAEQHSWASKAESYVNLFEEMVKSWI